MSFKCMIWLLQGEAWEESHKEGVSSVTVLQQLASVVPQESFWDELL